MSPPVSAAAKSGMAAQSTLDVFVGRQPIFNRDLKVVAYELLFRAGDVADAGVVDGDQATSQLLLNTFTDIGLDQIVGKRPAFINFTRPFILGTYSFPFPKDRVVMEILEDITVDEELIEAVHGLARDGYRIALDDFVSSHTLNPLVPFADIVKLDIRAVRRDRLEEHVASLRQHNVEILAEKVEHPDDLEFCASLGIDYFQGFFLSKPKIVKGRSLPSNRQMTLRVLAKFHDPDIELMELEEAIRQDLSLSYKLLRLVNSAFYGVPRKISSIRQALMLLGVQRVRAWATLLILSGINDKPHELMVTAFLRAKMCELLAQALDEDDPDTNFTVGLFSTLDAFLDLPMQEALASLPLSEDITEALLNQEGEHGAVLRCVLAYERGEWSRVTCPGLEPSEIRDAYLEAAKWAAEASNELK
ncbi:MAG: EAL and HDOD domain-containing protein [Candidatus Methylomirabilia bacterium]